VNSRNRRVVQFSDAEAEALLQEIAGAIVEVSPHGDEDRRRLDRSMLLRRRASDPDLPDGSGGRRFDQQVDDLLMRRWLAEDASGTMQILQPGIDRLIELASNERVERETNPGVVFADAPGVAFVAAPALGAIAAVGLGAGAVAVALASSAILNGSGAKLLKTAFATTAATDGVLADRQDDPSALHLELERWREMSNERLAVQVSPIGLAALVVMMEEGQHRDEDATIDFQTVADGTREVWSEWKPMLRPNHQVRRWDAAVPPEADPRAFPRLDPESPDFDKAVWWALGQLKDKHLVEIGQERGEITCSLTQHGFDLAEFASDSLIAYEDSPPERKLQGPEL
jgi:hypothetical protein